MKNYNIVKSLYIHIPFCDHICIYCDFYKMIAKKDEQEKYIDYLIKELVIKKKYYSNLQTIYIGGGTPSSLSNSLLIKLLHNIKEEVEINNIIEYTIEANPIDINIEFINTIKKYGITRVSLGVQSFDNQKLIFLHRNHNFDIAIKAIKLLQENNITNINCDIIYGVNNDSIALIHNDLKIIDSLNIPHVSTYSLIIEDKTILNKMIKVHNYVPISEDLDCDIYEFIQKFLKSQGYQHYEISNFSKPGYESKHNLTYWNDEHYISLGANASYYLENIRYTTIDNLNDYYYGIDNSFRYKEKTILSIEDEMYEYIMLGLRKIDGINTIDFFQRFNRDIITTYKNIIPLLNDNILLFDGEMLKVNEMKIYLLNDILIKILD